MNTLLLLALGAITLCVKPVRKALGIGRAIRNDFYGAVIESEDGNFRVEFSIIPGSGNVRAEIFQRTDSFVDPKNYDPQRMVEWFKWGSEYGRDLKTAAIKAGKIVKAQGGTISFGELGIEGIGAITDRNPKRAQLRIIQMYNPMTDDYHTGIRTVDDILSWRDVFEDTKNWVTYPDWDEEDIKRVLNERSVTIYSSYPIKNGVFVTPSRMNAEDYAGGGRIYAKTVHPGDVAWIASDEGQYAPIRQVATNRFVQAEF